MSLLDEILDSRKRTRQVKQSTAELKRVCRDLPVTRDFLSALRQPDRISVIAEIKFHSPSEGVLRRDYNVEQIAAGYAQNGASALSVLTEPRYFGGSLNNLHRARQVCALPVLRKDFLFDEFDVWESRATGADAILLIAKMLSRAQLHDLRHTAAETGLAVLLELHDHDDIVKSEGLAGVAWGVNHRNLDTLEMNLELSARLFPLLDGIKVAESGLRTKEDLEVMRARGADAVLIGTAFMKAPDAGLALAEFLK